MFFFEHNHLLLIDFGRDERKDLFLIKEQTDAGLVVEYPGELFTEQIMDVIRDTFFLYVREEELEREARFALGAYFQVEGSGYGAYYELGKPQTDLIFFSIHRGENDQIKVAEIPDEDYSSIAQIFSATYAGLLDINL